MDPPPNPSAAGRGGSSPSGKLHLTQEFHELGAKKPPCSCNSSPERELQSPAGIHYPPTGDPWGEEGAGLIPSGKEHPPSPGGKNNPRRVEIIRGKHQIPMFQLDLAPEGQIPIPNIQPGPSGYDFFLEYVLQHIPGVIFPWPHKLLLLPVSL